MLPKVANHLFLHTSRAVALVQNQSGTLRSVLQYQSSGSTASWGAGAGSSWGSAGHGAGPGGAKFNAGSKFYTGYTGAGRAITQANTSTSQELAKDDDREDTPSSSIKSHQPPSRSSRSLARRHSFSLPPGRRDHEQETGAGVLQTVQTHLRARHTFAPAAEQEQYRGKLEPPDTEDHSSNQPFEATVEEALAAKDVPRIAKIITQLADRDHQVQKSLRALEGRTRRRRLRARNPDDAALEAADAKQREELLAEDNFRRAMSIFDVACTTHVQQGSSPPGYSLASCFPTSVYHTLLRSCSHHSSIDGAIRMYSFLEARARSSRSQGKSFYPTTLVFYYLLSTYVNASDLDGAKEVFAEFNSLCARGQIGHLETGPAVRVWNRMMEAYFRAGQPAGALRLLETMMDAKSTDTQAEKTVIPSPASSTFTTIINGFCNPTPNTASGSPPEPDIATALSWFNRLLLQPTAAHDSFVSTPEPTRPDQTTWNVMLDALSQASTSDKSRIHDLNKLFETLVECAPKDKLDSKSLRSMVLDANLRFLEQAVLPDDEELARSSLSFVAQQISPNKDILPYILHIAECSNNLTRLYHHFVRFGMAEQAWKLAKTLVAEESAVIGKSLTEDDKSAARISSHLLTNVVPLALEAVVSSSQEPLLETVELMRYTVSEGVVPTPLMAPYHLHAYIVAPKEAKRSLTTNDYEILLSCALVLPTQLSHDDLFQGCAYQSLAGLLQAINTADAISQVTCVSDGVLTAVAEALYATDDGEIVDLLFGDLPHLHRSKPRSPTPTPTPSVAVSPPPAQVIIDSELSRHVDEWSPTHRSLTVHDGYARLQSALSADSTRYPHPIVLGRLINGLGRTHDIPALESVYSIAQQVLFSPYFFANPAWQTEAWFQIEDQMIVAHAHAGDMEAAYMHRDRITAAGGVPSPDAFGSLIECMRDTTDDTSNALDLFTDSLSLGVKPNVYLYNTIISKLAKARKADHALVLFRQMKDDKLRPSSITYGAVIAACARVGDYQTAEQLFEEMASQHNFRPRIPPYNTMMQMYTHTKPDRERVLHYYDLMLKAGIKPSAHTYKLLIDAYGTIEPINVEAMEKTFKQIESSTEVALQGTHWSALINAYGCVCKDLDKAINIFESISSRPSSRRSTLPDAVTYESLINVLVTHKRMDLVPSYLARLQATGVHMTAYIANLLIKGYAAAGDIEEARRVFESLEDPPSGVAAPNNHVPHNSASSSPLLSPGPSYREPSTWEAMFRAELGNGNRDLAVALLHRLQERRFPEAVYERIRGIMLDDSVSPWVQSPASQPQ